MESAIPPTTKVRWFPCTIFHDHNTYRDDDLILGELTYKDLWMYALLFMIMVGLILTLISVKGWGL